ncbi:hypothetical protein DN748_18840 [Sinomicrobium soli]|nr:hypothetical protein DN748_18840 [Sinomicrobium sp. N-1-3-6]
MLSLPGFVGRYRNVILEIISFLFILLFAYTAISKLLEPDKFFNNINNSPVLGGWMMAKITQWTIPGLELLAAVLIAIPKTRLKGFYTALALMLVFSSYVIAILFFSPYTPCSCGGVVTQLSWTQHLVFNVFWMLLAITVILLKTKGKKKKHPLTEHIYL